MARTFGDYLRSLREVRRLTLRKFCLASGVDPSYYCKIENGRELPPQDPDRLRSYFEALGLTEESPEARELTRLASLDRGEIPPMVKNDPAMMGQMPVLFRTIEEGRLTEEDLDRVLKAVREG